MPFYENTFDIKNYNGNLKDICIDHKEEDKYHICFNPYEYHLLSYEQYYNGNFYHSTMAIWFNRQAAIELQSTMEYNNTLFTDIMNENNIDELIVDISY